MSGLPQPPRATIADYMTWEGDWELWDGVPVAMSPSPVDRHSAVVAELIYQLKDALRGRSDCPCKVRTELDWHANESTVHRPDVMVLCGEPEGINYPQRPPALIFEVLSPSTRERDRHHKRERYAHFGVKNYFVVDPADRLLERLLGESDDRQSEAVTIHLHGGCTVTLPRELPED